MPLRRDPPAVARTARAEAARLERAGDLAGALEAYQAALAHGSEDVELLADLAGLAARLDMHEAAADLWSRVAVVQPERLEAVDGQARALSALGRFDAAVDALRAAIMAQPADARLWNALGVTLTQQGEAEQALVFLDEAARLQPDMASAAYNRGGALFDLGRLGEAEAAFAAARRLARKPGEIAAIDFARATLLLAQGRLAEGWDAYECRFSPDREDFAIMAGRGKRWTPASDVRNRRVLVLAEQGLGDELMFANAAPDLIAEAGQVILAVEPRLTGLFSRSFAKAQVTAHATDRVAGTPRRTAPGAPDADLWAPMGSLLRRYRRSLADFPAAGGYLIADPARVARWRAWLGDGPPAVGLTWRSGKLLGGRRREYPPLDAWAGVLRTPGVRFVNLQYGDCDDDLAALSAAGGADILRPPDLDIRNDLEGLAALCVALDTVVSVQNATGMLAGACGANLVLAMGPASWSRLGAETYPWYPQAVPLEAERFGDWRSVMDRVAAQLVR